MSEFNQAGLILGSLCSSVRLLGPRTRSWTPSLHLIRSFSHTSRHAKGVQGPAVIDPITGNQRRRTPGAPLPSSQESDDAVICRQAIEEGQPPETIFRSRLHTGSLSRAAAAVCLTEASQRGHTETKLGQTALQWLWDQRGDIIYPDDNDLIYAVVDLLLREGQEEEVWRWMSCVSTRPTSLPPFIRYEWRDTTLKGLFLTKLKLSTDRSLDDVIKAFFRSKTFYVPDGGATGWLFRQSTRYIPLQAHEMSPSINGGRRWDYRWSRTSIELWEEAVKALRPLYGNYTARLDILAMFHLREPNPEPIRKLFENALTDPDNPLHEMRFIKTRNAYRFCADYAVDELRILGRLDDAAQLDAACKEVLPQPTRYGDRPDREGIFAQRKPAKKLPFPKFK